MKLITIVRKVNVTRPICHHIVGEEHNFFHRGGVGIIIMLSGVLIAKHIGESDVEIVSLVGDAFGYSLHGIGLIPFIEAILKTEETML